MNTYIFNVLSRRYTKPGLQVEEKPRANHKYKKNNYSDDGLSGYTASSLKADSHRYILFVCMVCAFFFFSLQPGLSISLTLATLLMVQDKECI